MSSIILFNTQHSYFVYFYLTKFNNFSTMKKNFDLKIYKENINNKSKIIPLKIKNNDTGEIKYFPSYFSEWNNTAYFFNNNLIKNIPLYTYLINKIIKTYLNLILNYKYIFPKKKRLFLKDIYISNSKIKYTNSKAIIS